MKVVADQFDEWGYTVVLSLLSPQATQEYKEKPSAYRFFDGQEFDVRKARFGGFSKADAITQVPEFWPL